MRIAVLAVLFLSACASSGHYERGARPPAPTFRPQEDAPHRTGQPGHVGGKQTPRSSNQRYLEPSAAPGIYAADGDRERTIRLMFSQPAPATPEGLSPSAHRKCWEDTARLLSKEPRVLKLSVPEAKCLRNRVYDSCGQRMIEQAAAKNADFLSRFPPQEMATPRGRQVGGYDQSAFEESVTGRRSARACGREHEYYTDRVGDLLRVMAEHGDDVLGWRNP